jgi:hypothetical protein
LGAFLTLYKAWGGWTYWRKAEETLNDPSGREAYYTFAQVEFAKAIGVLLLTMAVLWALRLRHRHPK